MLPSRHTVSPLKKTTSHPQTIHTFFTTNHFTCPEHNTMSLDQYNKLMSKMLDQRRALAKLRAELEGREGKLCRRCGRFGHLARNCKKREEKEMKKTAENKFALLGSRVMQCGVRDVRRQEVVKNEVKCFGCGKEGHKKWECPRKRESKKEEAAPPRDVWEKVKLHSRAKGLPPRGARMSMEG